MLKTQILEALAAQQKEQPKDLGLRRHALQRLRPENGFATIVTGVRRCGKSTLLRQWAAMTKRKTVSVLFDDLRFLDFRPDDFVLLGKALDELTPNAVILDEIQDVDGWERFVAGLLLKRKTVFVTGSNAKMLSRELGTKLTGRHLDLNLQPFSYAEFIAFTRQRASAASFTDYLSTGGFPAYVKTRNRQVLTDLFNDILYRDIVARYGLTNTQPIKQLASYLLTHVGTLLAPSRLKDAICVQAAKTVLEYFDHLGECCLISRLERYASSPKARMMAQKKVYACDTGLIGTFERSSGENLGHKLENVIFNHLKPQGGDLTYFMDGNERECDFIHRSENGKTDAIQVCWELTDDNQRREIEGLASAMKHFGIRQGVIITHRQKDDAVFDGCKISIVPAHEFLTRS